MKLDFQPESMQQTNTADLLLLGADQVCCSRAGCSSLLDKACFFTMRVMWAWLLMTLAWHDAVAVEADTPA